MNKSYLNSDWRKVAASVYRKPVDSKIFGAVEIDVTDLETFISQKRKEGIKITLTHFFTLAVARALANEVPELNCFIRRGKIIQRESIDAMVSVLVKDREMSSVRVSHADSIGLKDIAHLLSEGISSTRSGKENNTMQMKAFIGKIPWPFRAWFFNIIKTLTIKWGISIPSIGLKSNNFGSFLITNIGSIGLDVGYPALFPVSNVAMVFVLGGISKKPVVINDKIEIRRIINLSAALDHRMVDAIHGGKLFRSLKNAVRNPEDFL